MKSCQNCGFDKPTHEIKDGLCYDCQPMSAMDSGWKEMQKARIEELQAELARLRENNIAFRKEVDAELARLRERVSKLTGHLNWLGWGSDE